MTDEIEFSYYVKDETGRSLNVYKAHRDGRAIYGIEVYMEDNGLTTFANGDTMLEAHERAELIKEGHRLVNPDAQKWNDGE